MTERPGARPRPGRAGIVLGLAVAISGCALGPGPGSTGAVGAVEAIEGGGSTGAVGAVDSIGSGGLAGSVEASAGAPGAAASQGPGPVVLSVATGRPIEPAEWDWQLRHAPVVLLGEIHDNPRQHAIRADWIRRWAEGGAGAASGRPAIVFEYFDRRDRAPLLALTSGPADARPPLATLLDTAGFNRQGWGWPVHEPLFEAARGVDADWIAAGVFRPAPRRDVGAAAPARDAAADGSDSLAPIVADADWSPAAQAALEQALVDGHCGRLPATALPGMARFQRQRDASLAEPVREGRWPRTLVLAGNGHVGRSHGVPRYLGDRGAGAISVGFVERAPGEPPGPTAGDRADYDWIVVTAPVADREDPCAAFNPPAPTRTPGR